MIVLFVLLKYIISLYKFLAGHLRLSTSFCAHVIGLSGMVFAMDSWYTYTIIIGVRNQHTASGAYEFHIHRAYIFYGCTYLVWTLLCGVPFCFSGGAA